MSELDKLSALRKYFHIEMATGAMNEDAFALFCRKCGKGWALNPEVAQSSDYLRLLNHARSHEEE